jgi:hypothetical protein
MLSCAIDIISTLLGQAVFIVSSSVVILVYARRTPNYRWEDLMGFSGNSPFCLAEKFENSKEIIQKKTGLGPHLRKLSGISIWPLKVEKLTKNMIFCPLRQIYSESLLKKKSLCSQL